MSNLRNLKTFNPGVCNRQTGQLKKNRFRVKYDIQIEKKTKCCTTAKCKKFKLKLSKWLIKLIEFYWYF